jgi:hypothetical protein
MSVKTTGNRRYGVHISYMHVYVSTYKYPVITESPADQKLEILAVDNCSWDLPPSSPH